MRHRYNYSNQPKHLSMLAMTAVISAYANLLLDLIINQINSRLWQMLSIFGFCLFIPAQKERNGNPKSVHFVSHATRIDGRL